MMNRRMFLQYTSAFSALTIAQLTAGCKGGINQAQLAALAQAVGTSVANLVTILGQSALATKITQLTQQLVGDIQIWKDGDPTSSIIQVIADLEAAIDSIPGIIPVDPQIMLLIDLALGTIQAILALFPPAAAQVQARAVSVRRVTLQNPPKKKADYAKQWNAIVDANPKLSRAHIN